MADIQQTETKKKSRAGVHRSKKLSTRIDLTPMVDLGFLLITFFVFTTTISDARVMQLAVPNDRTPAFTNIPQSKTISLILAANNTVFYYNGDSVNNMHITNYSANGLRQVIENKKDVVGKNFGNSLETIVLIKPTDSSSYENVVNTLDEMLITQVKTYILIDASQTESQFVAQKN